MYVNEPPGYFIVVGNRKGIRPYKLFYVGGAVVYYISVDKLSPLIYLS